MSDFFFVFTVQIGGVIGGTIGIMLIVIIVIIIVIFVVSLFKITAIVMVHDQLKTSASIRSNHTLQVVHALMCTGLIIMALALSLYHFSLLCIIGLISELYSIWWWIENYLISLSP